MNLKNLIRTIPDFPKRGVMFRDITPLVGNSYALGKAICDMMEGPWMHINEATKEYVYDYDLVLSAEARGFIFGPAIAFLGNAGFVIARKPGKLPWFTISAEYELEYGSQKIEIHGDSIKPGDRVLIVDDVIATGGTILALSELIEKSGGTIAGVAALMELTDLKGRRKIMERYSYPIKTLMEFREDEA